MKQGLYSMYDKLTMTYGPLGFGRSDAVVSRNFVASLLQYQKQQSEKGVAISPDDYRLDCVGEFDDETGVLTPCSPRSVPLAYPKEST